jgi:acetyl-CoA C-acetyltransferase
MGQHVKLSGRPVYVVDGARSPFLKAKDVGIFTGSDLAVHVARSLLLRQPFHASDLDEVILGAAMPGPDEANIAKMLAYRIGCGDDVPAFTVMRNCASGMEALDNAALRIADGRADLILAGGTDAMSHAPLLYNLKMVKWLSKWMSARSIGQRLSLLTQFRPGYLAPVIALLRGLNDPMVNLNMGQTTEEIAFHFNISREEMDLYSSESHRRVLNAQKNEYFSEIIPIIDAKGQLSSQDDGVREDSTPDKLAKLKPFFDKKYGKVTAGNSSQITDGAALLILASEDAVKKHNLPILGRIVDVEWAALNPKQMGLGPVHASIPLMQRHGLTPKDFDCWEINEAFAGQVLGCLKAFTDPDYTKSHFSLKKPLEAPSLDKLNIDGGAIALGHPIGASGARIVLHALNVLKRTNGKKAMAAICIGGGQGGAMYLERTEMIGV